VRAALGRVLAVDEGVVFLAALRGVGEGDLDVLALEVDRIVERLALHFLAQQVEQAVLRFELLAVEIDRQPGVQVRVVAAHPLDRRVLELRLRGEDRAVDLEGQPRARLGFFLARILHVLGDHALGELDRLGLPVAPRLDLEEAGQRVHRLDADAVQADGFLEGLAVVLRTGVDLGGAVEKLAERDAPAEVADLDAAFLVDVDLDLLAVAHDVLVDRVIDDFLEQDVDAIVGRRPVAELPDVHPGTHPDVFAPVEGLDVGFGVFSGHGELFRKSWRIATGLASPRERRSSDRLEWSFAAGRRTGAPGDHSSAG
jgi:hypothetical protein